MPKHKHRLVRDINMEKPRQKKIETYEQDQ